ncbi:hypothetical protein, partial [Escherichia coli]|uniref:hypothetical protein n=2 Tax=Escherichia coli TaxID=562 RepID=UPI001CDA060F
WMIFQISGSPYFARARLYASEEGMVMTIFITNKISPWKGALGGRCGRLVDSLKYEVIIFQLDTTYKRTPSLSSPT